MIERVLLAAILAGLAAGLVMGVIQHVRLTPLIIEAEKYEHVAHGHGAAAAEGTPQVEAHSHDGETWAPTDGWERTLYTTLTAMITGAGFALLLTGISFAAGIPMMQGNGVFWGLAGFLALSLAPAAGLPPELPGMAAAGLGARQAWWLGTAICTGAAIWFFVRQSGALKYAAAGALALLPHVLGAPQPPPSQTALPAELAAQFATASLGANFVFWLLLGLFLAFTLARFESDAKP